MFKPVLNKTSNCQQQRKASNLFRLSHWKDEPNTEAALEVLERDEGAQDCARPQGVAAPCLDGLGLGGAAPQEVDQGRVEP